MAQQLEAIDALRMLGATDADTVRDLIAQLGDDDRRVVGETITSLGMLGGAAETARPALQKLAEGDDRELRARAKAALRQLRGG